MKKDVLIAAIFISIIVIAAVVGAIMHHRSSGKRDGKISTTNTNTNVIKSTNDTTLKNNLSISGPKYTLCYYLSVDKTYNTTVVEEHNDSYTIILNGVLNYPPSYVSGNYTITSISVTVTFANGTTKYLSIPVYQNVELNENPERFYIYLHGDSPVLSVFYDYIQCLLKQGVYSISVTFNLMQNNEYTEEVQGELNL